ncbi:hypothetical protein TNCV_2999811 [Trichonephila clavipes]|nr:hypothetical protein TNCV_2999811 [Trichonephila clavipes]
MANSCHYPFLTAAGYRSRIRRSYSSWWIMKEEKEDKNKERERSKRIREKSLANQNWQAMLCQRVLLFVAWDATMARDPLKDNSPMSTVELMDLLFLASSSTSIDSLLHKEQRVRISE